MSQNHLIPCPSCSRHVFTNACTCPFCQAPLKGTCGEMPDPPPRQGRLGRTARLFAGASLLGASACQSTSPVPAYGAAFPRDAGNVSATDTSADSAPDGAGGAGGSPSDGAGGAGGSPSDAAAGAGGTDASPADAAALDAANDRSVVALYGGAFPRD
jgi:hypothetical protein